MPARALCVSWQNPSPELATMARPAAPVIKVSVHMFNQSTCAAVLCCAVLCCAVRLASDARRIDNDDLTRDLTRWQHGGVRCEYDWC